jgi:hypothetical protein
MAASGRYVTASFPDLTALADQRFDLIVSGNTLFAYADKLFGSNEHEIYEFHKRSVLNMARLLSEGGEVRIYPVGTASTPRYPRLQDLINSLTDEGFECSRDPVAQPPKVAYWDTLLRIKPAVKPTSRADIA